IHPTTQPKDFNPPPHLFPLLPQHKPLLPTNPHTQPPVHLPKLTPPNPAPLISEVMNDDPTMPKGQHLQNFKQKHQLNMITIHHLIQYPKKLQPQIQFNPKLKMPTHFPTFHIYPFKA
ncbi:3,4-dihydroxy-2-butanone-4-phosphate synthase, partial [Staphylococcus aureus]|uniref:3,4-dihydroxy-2-butanone-4-phosphate synthase n=1 Tax=Staphylococcus aureus TaxID=1280 RepID=UPI00164317A6